MPTNLVETPQSLGPASKPMGQDAGISSPLPEKFNPLNPKPKLQTPRCLNPKPSRVALESAPGKMDKVPAWGLGLRARQARFLHAKVTRPPKKPLACAVPKLLAPPRMDTESKSKSLRIHWLKPFL